MRNTTVDASWRVQAAMQMNHCLTTCALVKIVDVLRDDGELGDVSGELSDSNVSCVWPCLDDLVPTPFVPSPAQAGVCAEGSGGGESGGVEVFPEPRQGIAEGGDTAFGGCAGAGEDDDVCGRFQVLGDFGDGNGVFLGTLLFRPT